MTKYKKGNIVQGTVTGIESYGIFVSFDEYYSGLIHISEISHGFVKNVNDFVKIGDPISVEILEVDAKVSQLKLSIKNIVYHQETNSKKRKIIETSLGCKTLFANLPNWVDKNLKKFRNKGNYIDN